MNSDTIFASVLGIIVATCAVNSAMNDRKQIKEKFINVRRIPVVDTEVIDTTNNREYSVPLDYNRMLKNPSSAALSRAPCNKRETYVDTRNSGGDMFPNTYGVSNYQAMLSPRMGPAEGYRGNIRYNMPSQENMAVPKSPLEYGSMVENFDDNNSYQNALSQVKSSGNNLEVVNALPVANMSQIDENTGAPKQYFMVDKFMYSNARSRLNALGDRIRGDLAIVPCKSEWFRPSVLPQRDLTEGSLAIIGGADNSTANALQALKQASSGGFYTNYNLATKMSAQEQDGSLQYSVSAFV